MKNIVFKIFLLILPTFIFSQNLEERISTEICGCLGNVQYLDNTKSKFEQCLQKSFEKNYEDINKKLNALDNPKTNDFEDYYNAIQGLLLRNCKNFLDYRKQNYIREEQESIANCNDVKTGIYYYKILQETERSYLTFTKDQLIETRKNNVYSISKIECIDKCTYQVSLLETNSNIEETYLNNKPLIFRIIENNPKYFVVQTEYFVNGGWNNVKIFKLPFFNE